MQDTSPQDFEFLKQLNATIEANIAQEQFGVSELADLMNMSRSNLLRKVKKATNLSVSQLINQARLAKAMELLRNTPSNVSEVAQQVGFSSTSYFIKCFREHYGYPPGEASNRANGPIEPVATPTPASNKKVLLIAAVVGLVGISFAVWFFSQRSIDTKPVEKSIVVLPFKNDSNDSTNIYLINGLMESTLNNLQKIKDLRVLSRTSAEKYKNSPMTIPEMAAELGAGYFVEGSGQKMGDRIVLTVQLIDGHTDKHLWSKQYRRQASDIFTLQQEISKDIADEIRAVITPEELNRIDKIPTNNKEAWDLYLKGLDYSHKRGDDNQRLALLNFESAIKKDSTFALAYAQAASVCFTLDFGMKEKEHLNLLGNYADKALLYDPRLAESLLAKAMYYLLKKEFTQAPIYMEKALEYNPNSADAVVLLADFYGNYLPDTGKYLEYALKGLKFGETATDSTAISYFYLRLGNAMAQAGFVKEALPYIDKSLDYYPLNPFTKYVRAFVLCGINGDLARTRELLRTEFQKDNNRLDILKDIGKVSYYMGEYQVAADTFTEFLRKQEAMGVDMFPHENMILAVTFDKVGQKEKAKALMNSYLSFLQHDESAYNELGWAMYYEYTGDREKSLASLKAFTKVDNIQYWVVLFLQKDPMLEKVKNDPEYKKAFAEIDERFWKNNAKLRERLEEQGVGQF